MGAYPTRPRSALLNWCQAQCAVFVDHAAEIGLTKEEAGAFVAAVERTRADSIALAEARQAAKSATLKTSESFDLLSKSVGDVVRSIRAFAETAPDPAEVYEIARVPPPARPSPAPPPAQPIGLKAELDPSAGSLTLRWKCKNPAGTTGTSYIIRRRMSDQTEFAFIGLSGGGKKSFVDEMLVAGRESVQYTVQGQRGDLAGPISPIITIHFGRPGACSASAASVDVCNTSVDGRSADPARWNVEIPAPTGR